MTHTTVAQEIRDQINSVARSARGERAGDQPQEAPKEVTPQEAPEVKTPIVEPQEADNPEVQDAEGEVIEDAGTKRKSRAKDRIEQLAREKNELANKLSEYERYNTLIEEYNRIQQQQGEPEFQEFETQEQLYKALKEQAKKEILNEIKNDIEPIKKDYQNTRYQSTIQSWFEKNPEAVPTKDKMDELSQGFSESEKTFYTNEIMRGNTRVLDMLRAMAGPAQKDNSQALRKAINADNINASTASSVKSTRSSESISSFGDDLLNARKQGNFKELLAKHVIARKK